MDYGKLAIERNGKLKEELTDVGIFISQFGALGNGSDDSQAFKKAIEQLGGKAGTIILNGSKTYGIKDTITIPHNVSIEGNLAKIIPIDGGTFTGSYLFYVNSRLSNKTIEKWGGEVVSTIRNLKFENPFLIPNVKGFYTRGKTSFRNITFKSFYKGLLKEGTEDFDYTDMMHIETLYFINCLGTEALVEIKYNGDGLFIDRCHTSGSGDSNYNFLNLEFCNGGKIANCINGDIKIYKSSAVSIENNHCEHGKITIISSQVSLRDGYHCYHKEYQPIPISIISAANDKPSMPCVIENYTIVHHKDKGNLAKNYTDTDYFDAYFKNVNVKITNFFRRSMFESDPSFGMSTAVKISLDGTTLFRDWENAGQLYSKASYVSDNKIFTSINETSFLSNFILFGISLPNHSTFDEEVGTYYYQIIYYFGSTDRLIGKWGGGEQRTDVTDVLNQVPYLNISYKPEMQLSKICLYRGKVSGEYSHYVSIPIGNGVNIYDYGYFISTGERWIMRKKGSAEPFNSAYIKVKLEGENVIAYGTAIPVYGIWKKGDRIVNIEKYQLGEPGKKYILEEWECIATGSPGSWIEKRYLTSD
ncbi:hypothetical protein [Paenibacillus gallinarum]|uniref:Pectate lyase superfamily protein domain-containing protein n=1 Tax=Paenibacillus gallinarum TaxID=2762232 RepID=A0ABR8T507_9BACL|nr:hypothetical protein [Paenibacillus gallinarum]MBD7970817.1 hypothetical protein [Paenibacillus gallinarum]